MVIHPYNAENFNACVDIFRSNLERYFAEHELEDFLDFLENEAYGHPYFVLVIDGNVIACGGYEKGKDTVGMTWGMVKRSHHGQGWGRKLTTFRLKDIQIHHPDMPIMLDTSQHTKGFYEKQGFATHKVIKNGYAPGLDQYIMIKQT
jgi:ribosomal protein S18 acetylase RimI-like enzyme